MPSMPKITLPELPSVSMPSFDYNIDLSVDTEYLKMSAIDKFDAFKEISSNCFENIKYFGENAINEISKIWNENVRAYF